MPLCVVFGVKGSEKCPNGAGTGRAFSRKLHTLENIDCEGKASGEGKEYGTQPREAWHEGTSYQLPPEHY